MYKRMLLPVVFAMTLVTAVQAALVPTKETRVRPGSMVDVVAVYGRPAKFEAVFEYELKDTVTNKRGIWRPLANQRTTFRSTVVGYEGILDSPCTDSSGKVSISYTFVQKNKQLGWGTRFYSFSPVRPTINGISLFEGGGVARLTFQR